MADTELFGEVQHLDDDTPIFWKMIDDGYRCGDLLDEKP